MSTLSAYEQIKANIDADGKLPHTFSLEEKPAPNQIGFMPGAMDGVGIFHAGGGKEEKAIKKVDSLLRKYFKTGKEKYIAKIENILTNSRTISVIDPILESIRNDEKSIDAGKVFEASLHIVKTSHNIELVKLGIALLGLFDIDEPHEAREITITLSSYDDFTLYAVVAAANWSNGNDAIYKIAKRVDGWGKIHAVERLEPDTEEIKNWILRHGCSNGIMDAYLGLTCAVKGDLISALRQEVIDDELFNSAAIIIDALLDEGPVDGISVYEHANEAMTLFMRHAENHVNTIESLWRIFNIKSWAELSDSDYKNIVLSQCDEIASRPQWREKIVEVITNNENDFAFFCASNVASRMDVDISKELFAAVKSEPLKHYPSVQRLFNKTDMAHELIAMYESILPLNDMAEGMGDYLFSDKRNQEHMCLDFILPELASYPMQGVELIKTGLNSRVVRGRNMACRALSGWMKLLNKQLDEISPELYEELKRISKIEVNADTKEIMRKLLNGDANILMDSPTPLQSD